MPAFFPDGKRIAFIRDTEDGDQQLCLLDLASRKISTVGRVDYADSPAVSPDGEWIAYLSGPIFARQVRIVNVPKGDARQLTETAEFRSAPCWIDKGKRLAFAVGTGKQQKIVSIDPFAKAKTADKVLDAFGQGRPVFSESGKLVGMVTADQKGTCNLKILHADGKLHTAIPPIRLPELSSNERGCYDPAFSPNEEYLVYVRSDIQPASDLYLRNLKTGEEVALTADHADNQSPAFSPDGKAVAFVAAKKGEQHKIYLMALEFPAPKP